MCGLTNIVGMSAMRRGRLKTGSYKGVGKLIGHAAANMIGGAAFDQGTRAPIVSQLFHNLFALFLLLGIVKL